MINDNITIMFTSDGVGHLLTVNTADGSDNLPYDLATAFCEVVRKSCANPEIVIREMKDTLTEGESDE